MFDNWSTWGVQIGSKLMAGIQEWPSKCFERLGPNLSLLTCKILEPWIAISRCFPYTDFILGHPVFKCLL